MTDYLLVCVRLKVTIYFLEQQLLDDKFITSLFGLNTKDRQELSFTGRKVIND